MATTARFKLYGQWSLGDLDIFVRNLSIAYAYFYWLTRRADHIPLLVKQRFTKAQWGREFANETLPRFLLDSMAEIEKPQITSVRLKSPGWIEIHIDNHAMQAIDLSMGVWLIKQTQAVEAMQKIITGLKEFALASREQRDGTVQSGTDATQEANQLVLKVAPVLGLTRQAARNILELTGSPISSLRLVVTLAKACRQLASLQANRRIELPGLQDHRSANAVFHRATDPNPPSSIA